VSHLDDVLPAWDAREAHEARVDAPPAEVAAALEEVTPAELPVSRLLLELRGLPGRLGGNGGVVGDARRPLLDVMRELGFVELARDDGRELVLGAAGRFWSVRGNRPVPLAGRHDFAAFRAPGHVRAAMDFLIAPAGDGARVVTETRVQATDRAARRSFRRYWFLIRPWSGLIRREMLRALRRRVDRGRAER
jgi:hypothetical protein